MTRRAKSASRKGRVKPWRNRAPARIESWVKVRIMAVGGLLSALFCLMAYKAYGLQVDNADKYRERARRQHLRMVEVPAPRGAILDARGRELAVTADADSAYVNPREIDGVVETAEAISAILDLDVRTLEAKLSSGRHFAWLERHITAEEAAELRSAKLSGVHITQEPRRFYPGRQLAGPLLGFAGIDGKGLDGIELAMDDLLSGRRTKFEAFRDASGRIMMADGVARAEPGATITLSIDRSIQHWAEEALLRAVDDNDARAGTLVVIDVHTGEVMAMASAPGYDSNSPGRAVKAKARNRAVTDAFEIGSVMKIFTVAAALDAGVIDAADVIDVEKGRMRIGRKVIRDTHDDPELSISDIIKRSSNVGAAKIAQALGKEGLHAALLSYGFGAKSGIELPGERTGLVRPPKRWGEIGLATVSFGYGLTVTALQVGAALAAVGNGGTYREPRVIRQVADTSGRLLYQRNPPGRRIMKESTARALWPMMKSVFDKGRFRGTAHMLDSRLFDVGGKTGTARKVDPETRQYSTELYIASFAGLAPIDDPRIAVVVVIDEPKGEYYYGGRVAGPAFLEVVNHTLPYLGVPAKADAAPLEGAQPGVVTAEREREPAFVDADEHGADESRGADAAEPMPLAADAIAIPDFTGMSVKRALDTARSLGIAVEVQGSGRAVEQFPPPGLANRPAECRIVFSRGSPHQPEAL